MIQVNVVKYRIYWLTKNNNAYLFVIFRSNRDRQKLTGHIPAFIQAYNYFADSLSTVTPSFMATIVELINTFVSSYIHLNTFTRSSGIFAIRDLLRTLYYKGEGTLRSFLNDFCKLVVEIC